MSKLLKFCSPVWSNQQRISSIVKNVAVFPRLDIARPYNQYTDENPEDIERIENIEAGTVEFSPSRSRDLSGATLGLQEQSSNEYFTPSKPQHQSVDEHVESYDSHGSLSLNSVMQTNVPEPYNSQGKRAPTHLNMPGGHVGQNQKYLSDHLQNAHYTHNNRGFMTAINPGMSKMWRGQSLLYPSSDPTLFCVCTDMPRSFSLTDKAHPIACKTIYRSFWKNTKVAHPSDAPLSQRNRLKRAVKEYGVTVVIFHIGISLVSLGGFYLAVSSGVNMKTILAYFGVGQALTQTYFAQGASTFVLAYAIHKVFAPLRIAITLAATPFIVRYLRKVKIMKSPKR